jgi:exopolyphosphatase / guanosine-5'-triphosphate,3'-diphosphate pyrophosphatase
MKRCEKTLKSCLFIFTLVLPWIGFCNESECVVRAAIDIGSGATKLKVAQVNVKTQKIEKILVNESFPVQYQEGLERSSDQTFNESLMKTGLEALKKSKKIAEKHHAEKVVAVATASFRKAANADAFIGRIQKETGIDVHIIDQDLEGALGFRATTAQLATLPQDIVVWDIGGGSFQFSTLNDRGDLVVHRGHDASIPFKNHVIKQIQKKNPDVTSTPNPLNHDELQEAESHARKVSKKVDALFKKKIGKPSTKIIGIGNIFAYGIYPLLGEKSRFTPSELAQRVQHLKGKTDKDLGESAYVNVAVTNPILVLGFMRSLGIHEMDIIDVNNADGALLHPPFWDNSLLSS